MEDVDEKILALRQAIGSLAKASRKSLGMTQNELAHASGLSPKEGSAISDLENSKTFIGGVKHLNLASRIFNRLQMQNAVELANLYKALRELWVARGHNLT